MIVRPKIGIPKFFEGQATTPPPGVTKAEFDELTKLVKGLTTVVQQQTIGLNQIRTHISSQPAPTNNNKNSNDDNDDDDKEPDLDSMSNKDFAQFLMKNVGKLLEGKLGEFSTKLDSGLKEVRTGRAAEAIEKFRGTHKDFDEWGVEIGALAKQHPSLSIEQLYTLARTSDPEKAKTVDAKYVEKKEESNPEDDRLTLFGGFRPASGKTSGGDNGDEGKKLSMGEALDKSWDEAVAKFPALKSLGDDALD